jgi:hypothetical protein
MQLEGKLVVMPDVWIFGLWKTAIRWGWRKWARIAAL